MQQKGRKTASWLIMKSRRSAAALFVCVVIAWLAFDIATKAYFNGATFRVGQLIAGPFCGIFEFLLVHNTGAAWGIFGNATFGLGVFSLVVCAGMLLLFGFLSKSISPFEAVGLALVFSGGLGNALDRFTLGYVVDFIHLVFIDFPVFNIADIGVTCGIVLFLVGFFLREQKGEEQHG